MRVTRFVLALGGMALLAGCASKDLVVVIPESDGHVGAVVVEAQGTKTLLNSAYAAASGAKTVSVDAQTVNQIFGSALDAQPTPPKSYLLYFKADSLTLTPESKSAFEQVFADVASRKAAEVVVTGHTDTMGEKSYNDKLSLERAKEVSRLFTARGLASDAVIAAGRGERELLVPTGDQVPEPRNRRVEITVR